MRPETLDLYLNECVFRFTYRMQDPNSVLLRIVKDF